MKSFITVIGEDKIGIIQGITSILSENKINIMDINQTLLQNYFTMIMFVDLSKMEIDAKKLKEKLDEEAKKLGVTIKLQREEIFRSMHEV
ncbi:MULTISPECIES: ACT domain-containing protein [Clostridium]|jgi:ACT domain-containing protein|uniref:ACT domain-containing protein n=1 Tax=Clostridium TaxID=1485 RepID=UPI0002891AFC|nr:MULTISPECIES: ACT domain-containing protein [Clostridium]MDF2502809.1 protein-containing protein [Clostridium sp.]